MSKKKNELVFAKGKDGHYKYMKKSEIKKGNPVVSLLTIIFYIVGILVLIGAGYYLYTDIIKPFIKNYFN